MVLVAALDDPVAYSNRESMKNQLNYIYSKNYGWTGYLDNVNVYNVCMIMRIVP